MADVLVCKTSLLLQQIADQIFENPKIVAAAAALKPSESAPQALSLTGPQSFPGAAIHHMKKAQELIAQGGGKTQPWVELGERIVKSTMRTTAGSRIDFVHMHSKGGSYQALSNHIDAIKKDYGLSDADLANSVAKIFNGAKPDEAINPELAPFAADLTWLLFGVEVERNPATMITSAMVVDMISSGKMSFQDALAADGMNLGGGMFPMSFQGATRAGRQFPNALKKYPGPAPSDEEKLQLCVREAALVDKWLQNQPPSDKTPEEQVKEFAGKIYQVMDERGKNLR
jgi:hypothetical protein